MATDEATQKPAKPATTKGKATKTATKKRGRPKGSKTQTPPDTVTAELTRCRKCQSTDRTGYENKRELEISGTDAQGNPYTHVVWRDTRCKTCEQRRTDKTFENRK